MSEVQYMNSKEERQTQEKSIEDSIRQIEEDLRFLNWQVSRIEKMIRITLKKLSVLDLSTS
jgi:hypothetical protein